jgi:hypothetical protein
MAVASKGLALTALDHGGSVRPQDIQRFAARAFDADGSRDGVVACHE